MRDTSTNSDVPPLDVLDRWVAGLATADDRARVEAYVAQYPAAASLFRAVGGDESVSWDGAATIRDRLLRQALASQTLGTRAKQRSEQRGILGSRTLRTALGAFAAVLICVAGVFALRSATSPHPQTIARTYATGIGQSATITLTDGSRVTLAPSTTIRLSAFGEKTRTVTLDGEAYFDVPQSAGVPFIVRTGLVSTRVLGTTFFVRRYASDSVTRVAVHTGKVVVVPDPHPDRGVTIIAGRTGVVSDSANTPVASSASYTEWLDGQLVFRDAPAAEVLGTLTRWYGYQFRLADPALGKQTLTVRISTQSSAEALATLKRYLDVALIFEGNIVTLTPRSSAATPLRIPRSHPETLITRTREVGR